MDIFTQNYLREGGGGERHSRHTANLYTNKQGGHVFCTGVGVTLTQSEECLLPASEQQF